MAIKPTGKKPDSESRLVYSTEKGDLRKALLPKEKLQETSSSSGQAVQVYLDSKRRRGKVVTVIAGIQHNPQVIEELAKTLKTLCGAGGTVEGRDILIQGDQRERVVAKLKAMDYKVKAR